MGNELTLHTLSLHHNRRKRRHEEYFTQVATFKLSPSPRKRQKYKAVVSWTRCLFGAICYFTTEIYAHKCWIVSTIHSYLAEKQPNMKAKVDRQRECQNQHSPLCGILAGSCFTCFARFFDFIRLVGALFFFLIFHNLTRVIHVMQAVIYQFDNSENDCDDHTVQHPQHKRRR